MQLSPRTEHIRSSRRITEHRPCAHYIRAGSWPTALPVPLVKEQNNAGGTKENSFKKVLLSSSKSYLYCFWVMFLLFYSVIYCSGGYLFWTWSKLPPGKCSVRNAHWCWTASFCQSYTFVIYLQYTRLVSSLFVHSSAATTKSRSG